MQLGIIGLGRMGANIGRRAMRAGHTVVGFDANAQAVKALTGAPEGKAQGAASLEELVQRLEAPRTIWVMLPAGKITEEAIAALAKLMHRGDCIIDGGNTFFKDDVRRAHALHRHGIAYLDVGTSGGVWGLERGYCMRSE